MEKQKKYIKYNQQGKIENTNDKEQVGRNRKHKG